MAFLTVFATFSPRHAKNFFFVHRRVNVPLKITALGVLDINLHVVDIYFKLKQTHIEILYQSLRNRMAEVETKCSKTLLALR